MKPLEEDAAFLSAPWTGPRRWLGPLGRYRPSLFRKDMAAGFQQCGLAGWQWLPAWVPRWSSPEERLLSGLELRGKVVYDVGAFTGAYSLFFSRQVGAAGRVVAFEPWLASFARLKRNLKLNRISNVQALDVALGAAAESRPLFKLPGMDTTASLAREARTPLRHRSGSAWIEPLDGLMSKIPLPPPDFIKIDVEGMEIEVLEGAAATLFQYRPDLLIEVHGASRRHKSARVRQIAALLLPIGYRLIHAESGRAVDGSETGQGIASGHLFAQRGMAIN